MWGTRRSGQLLAGVLAVALAPVTLAGCGDGPADPTTTAATTTSLSPATTLPLTTTTVAVPTTAIAATSTTTASKPAPFTEDDLPALVMAPEEGQGLVDGLEYRLGYSGEATLSTVRHMTLVPPESLQSLGFVAGRVTTFFTDPFLTEFGKAGRSLVSLVLLFPTPEEAEAAQQVFVDSFDELWAEWEPLPPIQEGFPGARGMVGTDNTADLYPAVGFNFRVGNTVALVGSQGGAERDEPLPEEMVRAVAEDLLARAEARLAVAQAAAEEPWDVVALGDSFIAGSGAGGPQRGLAGAYARLLGDQLGVETVLHAYVETGTVADVNGKLVARRDLQEDLAGAEVVIVWLGYHNVLDVLWGESCETEWPEPLLTCLTEATATMPADYDALLGAIAALVSDEAVVMIGNQALGPPEILEWGDEPFWPELKAAAYDVWAEGIAAAAAAHGAILVDSAPWLTGPEGNQLLRADLLASDGIHFTAAGYAALAELFLEADGLGD
jgi:lysophospholipase L1-like esterase